MNYEDKDSFLQKESRMKNRKNKKNNQNEFQENRAYATSPKRRDKHRNSLFSLLEPQD